MTLVNPQTVFDPQPIASVYADPGDGRGFNLTDPGVYTLSSHEPWYYSPTDGLATSAMTAVAAGAEVVFTVTDTPIVRYVKTAEPYRTSVRIDFAQVAATAAAPGGSTETIKVLTADSAVRVGTATPQASAAADPTLNFAVGANETWLVDIGLWFDGQITRANCYAFLSVLANQVLGREQWESSKGTASGFRTTEWDSAAPNGGTAIAPCLQADSTLNAGELGDCHAHGRAVVKTGATAGTISLKWGPQGDASATAGLLKGSFLRATKVG